MEKEGLKRLMEVEELAEKKAKIHSRLLMDTALAKSMEKLALRHEKRKEELRLLLYGKSKKDGTMSALKEGGEE